MTLGDLFRRWWLLENGPDGIGAIRQAAQEQSASLAAAIMNFDADSDDRVAKLKALAVDLEDAERKLGMMRVAIRDTLRTIPGGVTVRADGVVATNGVVATDDLWLRDSGCGRWFGWGAPRGLVLPDADAIEANYEIGESA